MIQLLDYKKSYDGVLVLQVPQFDIPPGQHLISGANGTGKTTLLKSIAGIIPYEGSISIDGVKDSRTNAIAYRASVRYSPAEPAFPNFIKGGDMLNLYQAILPTDSKDFNRVNSLLGVDKFQNRKIGHYSSGMLKKLSLALAFMGDSKLIILDEPYNALDMDACSALDELIKEFVSRGKSFLMTSHQDITGWDWDMHLQIKNHQILLCE